MKYLLYLSTYNPFHIHVDRLLYEIFCKSDITASVKVHRCSGSLPYCPAIDRPIPQLNFYNCALVLKLRLIQTILRPVVCAKCMNATNKVFPSSCKALFPSLGLSLYFKSIILYFSRRKFRAKFNDACIDNTISCYLVSTRMEINDVKLSFKLSCFLVTRDFHIKESHRLLAKHSPDFIGMFNGRMLPYRSLLNVAVTFLEQPSVIVHERGFENSSFVFKINEPAHTRTFLSKVLALEYKSIFDTVPDQLARSWAQHFYEGRKTGANIDCVAPKYMSSELNSQSIYSTDKKLIVLYLTTPDEVDPYSDEFELIKNQWDIIPIVCTLINNSFGASNTHIVLRTHPNFFLRFNRSLYNVWDKINTLKKRLSCFDNVFIDLSPKDTSPFLIYKHSFLSISFASSSLLESEYFGTPSLVDVSHIYKYGVSYAYDFKSLLRENISQEIMLPSSLINELQSGVRINPLNAIKFSYIWYYMNTFRFDTLKYSDFDKIVVEDPTQENSFDFNFLKSHHHLDPINFIRSRMNSFDMV